MSEILQAQFTDLIETIRSANDDIAAGKIRDLKDLEKRVAKLCADVTKAGPETANALKPRMGEMISRLDELAQGLSQYKHDLKDL